MSTLTPRPPYTSAELKKLYPDSLELSQVQVFLRHGERTPTADRFNHLGLPKYWPFCNAAQRLTSAILKADLSQRSPSELEAWDQLIWTRRIETQGPNDVQTIAGFKASNDSQSPNICTAGELTDVGRQTTLALGQRLRNLYVDQLSFLPPKVSSHTGLYLRSTHMSRALESLQQAFTGLYPIPAREADYLPLIVTRRYQDDQLYPNNNGCARFDQLYKLFSQRAAGIYNESPELDFLNSKLQKHMPSGSRFAIDGHPALVGVMDTNNARRAHGLSLPKEFDDEEVINTIDRLAIKEWYSGYGENREYRTVGIGGLVGDINENIMSHIEGDKERGFKFSMNGCHDTTLAGLLSSFGAFEGEKWPPFTSHIAFELFRSKDQAPRKLNTGGILSRFFSTVNKNIGRTPFSELTAEQKQRLEGWYVRGRYNDRPVTIPGCKTPGKHLDGDESFCTLAAFKEIADKFVPKDWKVACKSNLGKPVLVEENIKAGY